TGQVEARARLAAHASFRSASDGDGESERARVQPLLSLRRARTVRGRDDRPAPLARGGKGAAAPAPDVSGGASGRGAARAGVGRNHRQARPDVLTRPLPPLLDLRTASFLHDDAVPDLARLGRI